MRRIGLFLLLSAVVLMTSPAQAQDDRSLAAVYYVTVKSGMEEKFEEGLKNHISKFHSTGSQPYGVSVVEMGAGMGEYHLVMSNRQMADFDTDAGNTADGADWQANVAPHIESTTSRLALVMPDLSYQVAGPPAAGLSWVNYYAINPGRWGDYVLFRSKLKAASEKADSEIDYLVAAIINGAEYPAFLQARPAAKWADFRPLPVRQLLIDAYGDTEAQRLLELSSGAIRGSWSFVTRYRPDLGYAPSGQ